MTETPAPGAHMELRGAVVEHGRIVTLGPVDLAIRRGDRVALIGPSGGGKSTLLRLLLGLERPARGEVWFGGARLQGQDLLAVRRRIGYVVQGGGLFPHLTARENVELVARWARWPRARLAARVAALAELARLAPELLARYPAELSGGQAQRVSLVRALLLEPEALLLDEPLGALDPVTRAELQEDLAATFARIGLTVVVVTHDLGEAARLAPVLALLRDGRLLQVGSVRALRERPADPYVARFLAAHRPPAAELA